MGLPLTGASRWFFTLDNELQGPYRWSQITALAAHGTIGPDDMLTQEGSGHWVRARALRGLIGNAATPAPTREESEPCDPIDREPPLAPKLELVDETAPFELSKLPTYEDRPIEPRAQRSRVIEPSPEDQVAPTPQARTIRVDPAPVPASRRVCNPGTTSKWPAGGVGILLGLGVMLFGFQWWQNTQDTDNQGKIGIVVEEQESIREVRAEKQGDSRREKDLVSNADRLARVVERLNRHRKDAGLAEVMLDAALSKACAEHAHYLARNVDSSDATPAKVYTQDPQKPEHSPAGAKAAQAALVAYAEPMHALERWIGRLFSRVQILAPELERVGIGFGQNAAGEWICVLDPVGGRDELVQTYPVPSQNAARPGVQAIVYPGLHQKDVSCVGFDRIDDAKGSNCGFPISLTFPPKTVLKRVEATMMDDASKAVDVRVSSPDQPLNVKLQRTSIGIHPRQPLEAGRTYIVIVTALANEAEWRHVWRFTTRK